VSAPSITLPEWRARVAYAGSPLYLGAGRHGPAFAPPQQGLLVLGPPRSGKTTSLVIPNLLLSPGSVVVTSTKPDVMAATWQERSRLGRCWLFDPSGLMPAPPDVKRLQWSPVGGCQDWDDALRTARAMTVAARPGGVAGDHSHWTERAESLLAPLLHAAAVDDLGIDVVADWVHRRDIDTARSILSLRGSTAEGSLIGLAETDPRELSGIWSTAAGVLSAYKSDNVRELARLPNFDPRLFQTTADTLYICASGRDQKQFAPLVVGLVEQIRAGAYESTTRSFAAGQWAGPPVALLLDEAANIAPIPELPSIVSEGGSQGVITMACFQDLSQARARWGQEAEGFMTLFGTNVVLGGIRDIRTLDQISRLAGDLEVPHNSVTRRPWPVGRQHTSVTYSTHRQPRLPVDLIAQLPPGQSILLNGPRPPSLLQLTPWFLTPPFTEARRSLELPAPARQRTRETGRSI
jgi:type IV secretion system protein VirD4